MIRLIAAAAALTMLAGGAAHAGGYGPTPPYESGAYGYAGYGGGDDGFTLAGAHAGVTVLGISLGGGARLRIGGGGGGYYGGGGGGYAPPAPVYQVQGYQNQGYQGGGYGQSYGGYYGQPAYAAPVAYPQPVYQQPACCAPPPPPPCGCAQQPVFYQPY